MQRILENLPHLVIQPICGNLSKNRNILPCVLHVDVNLVGIRLILRRSGFHNGVENCLLARKVVVKRRRLDADRRGNLPHADAVVAPRGEQLQRLVENFLLRVFLFHLVLLHS